MFKNLGGWKQRKNIDPEYLHFFFDHWMLSWLPKGFRKFFRCGISLEEKKEDLDLMEKQNIAADGASNGFSKRQFV